MEKNNSSKNIIYIGILAIMLIIAAATLFLYYSQPFKEDVSFKDSVDFGDVAYRSRLYHSPMVPR